MAISTPSTSTTTTTTPSSRSETDKVPRGPVTALLNFYSPPTDGSSPFNHVDTPPAGLPQRNFSDAAHPVTLTDVRGSESSFTLDHDAFAILTVPTPSPVEIDFTSETAITTHYYPEVTSLLLSAVPGSTSVIIFDHTIRRTKSPSSPSPPLRAPVQRVHIDQTALSAAARVRRHASSPGQAAQLLSKRYRIINVWRPLNKSPVESFPLAFCSSASLDDADVVPVEHRYASGYVGQTAAIRHNAAQRWYYLSGMRGDSERILLECFDSEALKKEEGSEVNGGRVAHTAFADPRTRKDAEGRESIEVRALVFGP